MQTEFYLALFGPLFRSGFPNQELSTFNNMTKVEKFQDLVRYLHNPRGYIPCTPPTPSQRWETLVGTDHIYTDKK